MRIKKHINQKISFDQTLILRINPFTSHKWPRQNFSLQYQYNIKQAGDENREEYQS